MIWSTNGWSTSALVRWRLSTKAMFAQGLDLARRYGIHYDDAALLAAAEYLGAPILYTEDLNHNQVYGSVRAVNPFL